ncbi:hypothetical protein F4809DRAFT_644620 [Biscogniauxia mediterranea]|nr:hypothetical protein F4809DRAFT_644620 [Biscogniauxia mediterranea]
MTGSSNGYRTIPDEAFDNDALSRDMESFPWELPLKFDQNMASGVKIERDHRNDKLQQTDLNAFSGLGNPPSSPLISSQESDTITDTAQGLEHIQRLTGLYHAINDTSGMNGYLDEGGFDARDQLHLYNTIFPGKGHIFDKNSMDTSLASFFKLAQYDIIVVSIKAKDLLPITTTAKIDMNIRDTYCTYNKARDLASLGGIRSMPIPKAKRRPHLTPFGEMTPNECIEAHIEATSLYVPPIPVNILVVKYDNGGRNEVVLGSRFFEEARSNTPAGIRTTPSPVVMDCPSRAESISDGDSFQYPYGNPTRTPCVPQLDISVTGPQSYCNSDMLSPNPSLLLPSALNYLRHPIMSGTQSPMTVESSSDFSAPEWSSVTSLMGDSALEKLTWQSGHSRSTPLVTVEPIDAIMAISEYAANSFKPGIQQRARIRKDTIFQSGATNRQSETQQQNL